MPCNPPPPGAVHEQCNPYSRISYRAGASAGAADGGELPRLLICRTATSWTTTQTHGVCLKTYSTHLTRDGEDACGRCGEACSKHHSGVSSMRRCAMTRQRTHLICLAKGMDALRRFFFFWRERIPSLFRVHDAFWANSRLRREPPSTHGKESSALLSRNSRRYVRCSVFEGGAF